MSTHRCGTTLAKLCGLALRGYFLFNNRVFLNALMALFLTAVALPPNASGLDDSSVSANPGAVDIVTGTGRLGRLLGFDKASGVQLGGVWLGDANYLISGGAEPGKWSFNSLVILDLNVDLEKRLKISGAQFGVDFLQFNGQPSNGQAGVVSGYNSLPGLPPLGPVSFTKCGGGSGSLATSLRLGSARRFRRMTLIM